MIEILRITEKEIKRIDKVEHNCWINITEPDTNVIKWLRNVVEIPDHILHSLEDIDEVPSIEEYKKYSFIIIRTPYDSPKSPLSYETQPLGIFLHDDFVITICYWENDAISKMKTNAFAFKKSQFVLRLLLNSSKLYLTYLKEIHKKIIKNEEDLEKSQKNKVIMNFLELEKSLVYFDTSIKSNQILIEKLSKNKRLLKHTENSQLLDHVVEETKQGVQMTEVYSNILSNTLDAFASIISNNLNIAMKTLTSLTLIFNIPILIASVYGMNVAIPLGHSPYAFVFIMGVSLLLSMIAVYIFMKKKFF